MFRFLRVGQQAFKAILRPASVQFHTTPLAYTSSQTHGTIARRFSSRLAPKAYHVNWHDQWTLDRSESIDTHETSRDPKDYDVSIADVKRKTLETTISNELGIKYLSKATPSEAQRVLETDGYIYGWGLRPIIPLVVAHERKARWVFFVMDTAAPLTYLSDQACKRLGMEKDHSGIVTIGGYSHRVYRSPEESQFSGINILSGDFCCRNMGKLSCDYATGRVTLYFGKDWDLIQKSKL
ncbi:hypothetical protein B9Z19DRAFT_1082300 [Tuber borchii]|uniref:Uncharacterized protein n=1 Tax=Tuber borchii TaxID=42251 RepID=A0A2T6ZUW2_TUBBO|nr:hypothetical protein B9Z19DRAFT_1082300 [Tuber borchii]